MFGFGRKFEEKTNARLAQLEARLTARINAIDARLPAVEASLDRRLNEILTRYEQHPDERVRFLLNSIGEELRGALSKSLDEARQIGTLKEATAQSWHEAATTAQQISLRAQGDAARQPRLKAALNTIHRSPWIGYVFMYFDGGFTPSGELLVGNSSPPQECVGEISNINTYAGCVVRPGEFWIAKSSSDSVKCFYTPFL